MSARLPDRLSAAPPGWRAEADVVVIGSGIAGLTVALRARSVGTVLLVTKADLGDGSTRWAQGGIAAAIGPGDSPDEHLMDTLVAGAGLCDVDAVRVLVDEGPAALRGLIEQGATFDVDAEGGLSLTREGGHHRNRIVHAGGDATGAEISRALVLAALEDPDLEIIENALVLDLQTADDGAVCGATLHVMGEGQRGGVGSVGARVVVLATGGMGQVFEQTTNPVVSTGDGVAVALRAGATVADLEFVQFHPTVLYLGVDSRGQQPLISEAVRGEGAYLVDDDGKRFMLGVHDQAELAPRDVVAKAIMRTMRASGAPHVWLDGRHFGAEMWSRRFPTILESCRSYGIDAVTDLIPVAPACHYASGGVRTDLHGRTSVPGLFACGEVACTGVHGANRLASNSLLEGLVFAERIDAALAQGLPERQAPASGTRRAGLLDPTARAGIQATMTEGAGVLRSRSSLEVTDAKLRDLGTATSSDPCTAAWETTNLHTVASFLVAAAARREETRGSHWREDFPDVDDVHWHGRLVGWLSDGRPEFRFEQIPDEAASLRSGKETP